MCTAAACLFTVASCSDSGSPEAGASSVPSYAAGQDQHSAKQFASYWVDTLNKATVTGKTATLKSISLDSCVTCLDFAKQLDSIYGAGGHVETTGWDVQTVVPEKELQDEAGMSVKVQVAPQTVVSEKGARPSSTTAASSGSG